MKTGSNSVLVETLYVDRVCVCVCVQVYAHYYYEAYFIIPVDKQNIKENKIES